MRSPARRRGCAQASAGGPCGLGTLAQGLRLLSADARRARHGGMGEQWPPRRRHEALLPQTAKKFADEARLYRCAIPHSTGTTIDLTLIKTPATPPPPFDPAPRYCPCPRVPPRP